MRVSSQFSLQMAPFVKFNEKHKRIKTIMSLSYFLKKEKVKHRFYRSCWKRKLFIFVKGIWILKKIGWTMLTTKEPVIIKLNLKWIPMNFINSSTRNNNYIDKSAPLLIKL